MVLPGCDDSGAAIGSGAGGDGVGASCPRACAVASRFNVVMPFTITKGAAIFNVELPVLLGDPVVFITGNCVACDPVMVFISIQ